MPDQLPVIEPAGAGPTEPEQPAAEGLPEELIKIPAIQGLLAGEPAALSANIKESEKSPTTKLVVENAEPLKSAGIGFYRSLSGETAVLFNQIFISGEEIKAADAAGKLQELAPPFSKINQQIGKMGAKEHPVLNPKAPKVQGAPVPQPPVSTGFPSPVKQPSAAAQKKALAAKLMNAQPGVPSSGAAPGAGRLLNNILKPVLVLALLFVCR